MSSSSLCLMADRDEIVAVSTFTPYMRLTSPSHHRFNLRQEQRLRIRHSRSRGVVVPERRRREEKVPETSPPGRQEKQKHSRARVRDTMRPPGGQFKSVRPHQTQKSCSGKQMRVLCLAQPDTTDLTSDDWPNESPVQTTGLVGEP